MKIIDKILFLFIVSIFVSCNLFDSKINYQLKGFEDEQIVIFETDHAKIIFSKENVIYRAEKRLKKTPSKVECEQLIELLNNLEQKEIIIPDTFATVLKIDPVSNEFGRYRDFDHDYAYANDCFERIMIELIEAQKAKAFNKLDNKNEKEIMIHYVTTNLYGSTDIYLPNDTLVISILNWIR